jgi:hypothetical protein
MENAGCQINWRNQARQDPLVRMYEDNPPETGDNSVYFTTTICDSRSSVHQPWHFYLYDQLRNGAHFKHRIYIPEQRKSCGGNRHTIHLDWQSRVLRGADHLVFFFHKDMKRKEAAQLYLQIGLALGHNKQHGEQQIWVVSNIGHAFCPYTRYALERADVPVFGHISQVVKQLKG